MEDTYRIMRRKLLSGGSTRNACTLFWCRPSSSFFLIFSFYLDIPFDGLVPCCVQNSKEYFIRNKAKWAWLKNDNNKGVEAVLKKGAWSTIQWTRKWDNLKLNDAKVFSTLSLHFYLGCIFSIYLLRMFEVVTIERS